jgi:hypothetical protein
MNSQTCIQKAEWKRISPMNAMILFLFTAAVGLWHTPYFSSSASNSSTFLVFRNLCVLIIISLFYHKLQTSSSLDSFLPGGSVTR